ncbi:hypothetical protein S245_007854 [Arachis hypogaea]
MINFFSGISRLGHAARAIVASVLKACNILIDENKSVCTTCIEKSHQLPFPVSNTVYTTSLELVHSNIWGPAPTSDLNCNYYFVNFIDAYSHFTWLYLIKNKSQLKWLNRSLMPRSKCFSLIMQLNISVSLRISRLRESFTGSHVHMFISRMVVLKGSIAM